MKTENITYKHFVQIPYFFFILFNKIPAGFIIMNKKIAFETAYTVIKGRENPTAVKYRGILKTPSIDNTVQKSINNEKKTPAKSPIITIIHLCFSSIVLIHGRPAITPMTPQANI